MVKTTKTVKSHKMIDDVTQDLSFVDVSHKASAFSLARLGKMKVVYVVIALLTVTALLVANKHWFLAGIVNGNPVWRWQLNDVLTKRYGEQTLEGIISEKLIENETKKSGVVVTPQEVQTRETEIVSSLGEGVTLEQLLQYQGITKEDFDSQVKLQLMITKLLGKDIVVTDQDVTNFIATSSAMLTATEPAALQKEARDTIMEQKIGEKLQTWFMELKDKSQILRFL